MKQALQLFPPNAPIGNVNGVPVFASPEFFRALQIVYERVGGAIGPSTSDLAQSSKEFSGLEESKHEFGKMLDALGMAPQSEAEVFTDPLDPIAQPFTEYTDPIHPLVQEHTEVQMLLTEMAGLREQVANLQRQINDLQQGTSP